MSEPQRDRLDSAIDQVAARMVRVPDADLTARIVNALPERSRFTWVMPRLAALTAFAIAAVVWTTRPAPAPTPLLPSANAVAVAALPGPALAKAPGTGLRTLPLEPVARWEPLEPLRSADHDRSLPPLEALNALVVRDVTPEALPASKALTLAPIGIAELPLTAETFSPLSKE